MRLLTTICVFICSGSLAQVITSAQQKALNNYIDYANHSAEEVAAVVKHLVEFYPSIDYAKKKKSSFGSNYTCNVQPEDFYFNNALAESKVLGSAPVLNIKLKSLRLAAENIDEKCKVLDTYYKLEDYKQDNYAKAEEIINAFPALLNEYQQNQIALMDALEQVYKKLNKYLPSNVYHKTDLFMRDQIRKEQTFIDSWTLNINDGIHTGWPVDKLELSISDTDKALKLFEPENTALKYPASSMVSSFKGSMASMLETKKSGLDGYNFEAKKSDEYSNDVYLNLINYFNGALVADYNAFINYASSDNYLGLKAMTYIPRFEMRTQEKQIATVVKPFQDIPRSPLAVTPQKMAISKSTFDALNNYIDLINELLRQSGYLQQVWRNLNSDATYYKTLTSYQGRGGMHFDYGNFQLPLSLYQSTISESTSVHLPASQSLNEQAQVLLNILKEMDDLSASLEIETKERRYEKDNLKNIFQMLERGKTLFELLDMKKEQLYDDVRDVFESYPVSNGTNSWRVSGVALQQLVDFDHEELFKAKAFYKNNSGLPISTAKIDETIRSVIANEYTNMKGIVKIGRNNGLCPYTPYEDLPQSSKTLSEKLIKLKPATTTQSGYEHPYHEMVYHYNDVVDDLNKFSELSKEVFLLKTVKQPELFFVSYPEKKTRNSTTA